MSVLPQLERDLLEAAERRLSASSEAAASGHGPAVRGMARRLRLPAIALVCLLAVTTIALAASGVILTGAPVRPEELLNPNVGEGVPAPGASRLLPLRVPDPEGGLPWGMRIVHTTRGDLCVQIGRVQNGQLGELGIDGAFNDDGRFHPMPADALPADEFHGHLFDAWLSNANSSCELTGEASVDSSVGVERSAAANVDAAKRPLQDLRDIYSGILGPEAVSVSYRAGKRDLSVAVVPSIGAYLIVRRAVAGRQNGTGGASIGTEGDLTPSPRSPRSPIGSTASSASAAPACLLVAPRVYPISAPGRASRTTERRRGICTKRRACACRSRATRSPERRCASRRRSRSRARISNTRWRSPSPRATRPGTRAMAWSWNRSRGTFGAERCSKPGSDTRSRTAAAGAQPLSRSSTSAPENRECWSAAPSFTRRPGCAWHRRVSASASADTAATLPDIVCTRPAASSELQSL